MRSPGHRTAGLRCDCGAPAHVLDSRAVADGLRRRRHCLTCGRTFTTYEYREATVKALRDDAARLATIIRVVR